MYGILSSLSLSVVFILSQGCASGVQPTSKPMMLYVGTYTGPNSQGIYMLELDPATGALSQPRLAGEAKNPSFLVIHPSNKYLYSIDEIDQFDGKKAGAVSAFAIDGQSGKLKLINQRTSGGPGPCFVSVDHAGKNVLVANYGGGSVECVPVNADGSLGTPTAFIQHEGSSVDASRQKEPHAHSINPSPDDRFAIAADLGLDKLLVYKFDVNKGTLAPNNPPFTKVAPGQGPRHFVFHPNGKWAYNCNEMGLTACAFDYDAARGILTQIQSIGTLPEGADRKGASTAEVQVHPSGRFLYVSNRGHDSIAIFSIDQADGKLTAIGHVPSGGKVPRNFRIDPTGQYLLAANQGSGNIVVFKIDQRSGGLTPTGSTAKVASACCIKFLMAGN